jgi:endothelin-converting enzyme/putative endopeptidase
MTAPMKSCLQLATLATFAAAFLTAAAAQTTDSKQPPAAYTPTPSFDLSSIDTSANPCNDFYKFACGHYAANHPIPADQGASDGFYNLFNVNTQELRGILETAAAGGAERSVNARKIGDYYHACMNTAAIDADGLKPLKPLLGEIDSMDQLDIATVTGKLQRIGVGVLFSYGEQQDFKDASKQIASIDQGGLGMPEKDFYLRTGAKDVGLRKDYVAYIAKILTLSGTPANEAATDANDIMEFETKLAKASMGITERRDPEKVYHLVPIGDVTKYFPMGTFGRFEEAIHSPHIAEINDANPSFIPAMVSIVRDTDIETLRAYMRFHLISSESSNLPEAFDQATFEFYSHDLGGSTEQRARWKRCSGQVDGALGEALGEVYVKQYFAGDSKAKMLVMVHDIEDAMDKDIDTLDWMSPATKVRAKEKLHAVANKIGYPDHWRDYSSLIVSPTDAVGNAMRSAAFENDRELNKIGKPVDHNEWDMTPPTVNAYYNPSMNDINFPAGILQPNFYDPKADLAVNYGHIGAVIGHELTHGFDDEGKKFDAKGNLADWWTPADTAAFEKKTGCLVNEYNQFIPVDDVHVNGKLTLGENTADNGGLVLAFMAYLDRAKQEHLDINAKVDGYTGPQRFYIAFAQNWCSNDRPESLRTGALTDPHSPDQFRTNGPIVNQPGFAGAFSCKVGSPMVPANSCRVW